MNKETLRMQMLAGIITESQYAAELNEETYINDNGISFRLISKDEFDSLNEFGIIGVFLDKENPESNFIAYTMYDKEDDFNTDEEAKLTFDDLFNNPEYFEEGIYDDLYDSYKKISNKDRFELKELIPATFA
jgi:hypothetical protein